MIPGDAVTPGGVVVRLGADGNVRLYGPGSCMVTSDAREAREPCDDPDASFSLAFTRDEARSVLDALGVVLGVEVGSGKEKPP